LKTAVFSAYVQPTAERYLSCLRQGTTQNRGAGRMHIMQSNCGVDFVEQIKQIPTRLLDPIAPVLTVQRLLHRWFSKAPLTLKALALPIDGLKLITFLLDDTPKETPTT
jgi:hypothetical protein